MIVSIRVDDRLIHGQVALVWTKELNTPGIVVANDAAAKNEMQRMTLQMAIPTGKKLLVKTVDDAIKVFNDPRSKEMRIFVLTNCIRDTLKLVENCPDIQSVNIANVGRFDGSEASEKIQLNATIMLNKNELEDTKKLINYGIPVYHQLIPSNSKVPIKKLLSDAKII